ncbi:PREDICTED: zinc finger and BTB domain-containing protein 49-like [Cyprinodon variegatus]|uniref:zinc finger and BTB domain-containing protein 49-like n=1 Tax=Cyprinodon variegatus TaxID=28743 RepID=UPI0007429F00|nr:PREDICTED: zinc finger and BTB domain-containing protein 49-like [Cyprinodon variegatus]
MSFDSAVSSLVETVDAKSLTAVNPDTGESSLFSSAGDVSESGALDQEEKPPDLPDLKQTVKEEVPEDHKPSPDLHDPEPHHIKEEQEEVCTSLGGEQLGLKEEIDAIKFPITAAPIKSEDDKHSSVLPQLYHHHIKGRELPVENHGGEESMRIQDHEDGSISSETEEDSDVELSVSELKQLAAFGLKTKNMEISWKKVTAPKPEGNMADKHFISEFAVQLLQKDMKHSEIGPSSSLDKMKSFKENNVDSQRSSKKTTEFICEDCGKTFTEKHELNMHKTIHTGSKPFCCDLCKQRFSRKVHLNTHLRIHTGQKPFCYLKQTVKEEVPEDHKPSPDLHDPEPHHIKEEQEEVCTSLGGEQLGVKEEIDAIKFPITAAPIKSEDDKHSSVLPQLYHHHIKGRELPVENHGGEESMRIQDHEDGSISSETEEDSDVELSVSELKQLAAPDGNMADKPSGSSEQFVQRPQKDTRHSSSLDLKQTVKEEVPEDHKPSPDLHDPEPHHIKEEQEEVCTSLGGEQLGLKEEIDAINFTTTTLKAESFQ